MKAIDILNASAETYPDSPVVIDRYGSLTYAGLKLETDRACLRLKASGLKQGMNAAICFEDSREFIIYLFAASACGATVVPLGADLNPTDYQLLINDFSVDCLIHTRTFSLKNFSIIKSIEISTEIVLSFFKVSNNSVRNNFPDAAFIRPTSGTTGKAKGVVFSHNTIFERIDNALKGMKIDNNDRVLWVLPMAYHFIVSIILYVRAGASVIIPKDKTSFTLIDTARRHDATILYAGPLELISLAEEPLNSDPLYKLPPLKYAICTVGGVSANMAEKFSNRHDNRLRQVYGMIEAGLAIGNLHDELSPIESVGKVMHGFTVKLFDQDMNEVSCGKVGEIGIRGKGLFDGYYPNISRNDISKQDWFLTGDFASINTEGDFTIFGRNKSMLELGGRKIFCEEIENVINDHPAVRVSRVFLTQTEQKCLAAEIEVVNGSQPAKEELMTFCRNRLEAFKVPQELIFKDKISLTATGKVKRNTQEEFLN